MTSTTNRHVLGSYPIHVHKPENGEQWECNSPYCEDMNTPPPEEGGPPVVHKGLEPWRGR